MGTDDLKNIFHEEFRLSTRNVYKYINSTSDIIEFGAVTQSFPQSSAFLSVHDSCTAWTLLFFEQVLMTFLNCLVLSGKKTKVGSNISGAFMTLMKCNDHIIDLISKCFFILWEQKD